LRSITLNVAIPAMMASNSSQPQLRKKALMLSMATVSAGNERLELVNTAATCGTT
jgi:hypothetical protein